MHVAAQIQEALHHCGIHSTTIQPEYMTPGSPLVRKVRPGPFCNPEQGADGALPHIL